MNFITSAAVLVGIILTSLFRTYEPEHIIGTDSEPVVSDIAENTEISDMADFGNRLFALAAEKSGNDNALVSPLSAYVALSMLAEGAEGETLAELQAVMGETDSERVFEIISHLSGLKGTVFTDANSVWVEENAPVKPEYVKTLTEKYLAESFSVRLSESEKQVNSWISDKTNGLIKDMLDETDLDGAVMALVNALYLKAEWADKFNADVTGERSFTDAEGNVSDNVPFMRKTAYGNVIETDSLIGVSLPYSDGSLTYVAVMPKDGSVTGAELAGLVSENGGFSDLSKASERRYMTVYLPKYEHECSLSLTEILSEMGINRVFSAAAELGGIGEDLCVDEVLQRALIKVNESGTEAAAATVITVKATSAGPMAQPEPVVIDFNRPFVYAVCDSSSGALLFAGSFNRP